MNPAITLKGITKTFGSKVAVDDLDLEVPVGSLCGFIGPNGAGKTTTIRMIMSILFPDSGEVAVLGHSSAMAAKDRIGYLPEERGIYRKMKVQSFLRYMGRLKGADVTTLEARISSWLEKVGLAEVAAKPCEELSKGMQQKIQFLAAIIHQPDLLILDEPFSGLDPVNMRLLRDLILEERRRGATIIFSTHVLTQAEELCDHLFMINGGRKVLDGSLDSIRNRSELRIISMEPLDSGADMSAASSLPMVVQAEKVGREWHMTLTEDADPHQAMQALVALMPPLRVEIHRPSLEDIFIEMVEASDKSADERTALRAALRVEGASAAGGSVS
jgi:ABC-2 type transport system ATP-binding protein